MQSWIDVEIAISDGSGLNKKNRHLGRFYGDRLEIAGIGLTVYRNDILRYRKFLGKIYLVLESSISEKPILVSSNKEVLLWLDPIRYQKKFAALLTFVSSLLLGLWKPGISFWPFILLFSLAIYLVLQWFFRLLDKPFRKQLIISGALAIVLSIPTAFIIPSFILVFTFVTLAIIISFPLILYKKNIEFWVLAFLSGIWFFIVIVLWHWTIFLSQLYFSNSVQKNLLVDYSKVEISQDKVSYGNGTWNVPQNWKAKKFPWLSRYVYNDLCSLVRPLEPAARISFLVDQNAGGWIALSPNVSVSAKIEESLQIQINHLARLSWILYLGRSEMKRKMDQSSGLSYSLVTHTFFKTKGTPAKAGMTLMQISRSGLHTGDDNGLLWTFCFEAPEKTPIGLYEDKIINGFINNPN